MKHSMSPALRKELDEISMDLARLNSRMMRIIDFKDAPEVTWDSRKLIRRIDGMLFDEGKS